MKTVAIIGVGLIGGSLGQALRKSGRYRVLGIGRHHLSLRQALQRKAAHQVSTKMNAVAQADIVVICTPVRTTASILQSVVPFLKPGALVTDAGSVKGSVLSSVSRVALPKGSYFVGAHPLAGSHRTGVLAARPDLFQGASCVVVPTAPRSALQAVSAMWKIAGAKVLFLDAATHDRLVAFISHMPHLLAHALVHVVARHPQRRQLMPLLAGSFRDITRVASSDPEQWSDILALNAQSTRAAIRVFEKELQSLSRQIGKPALQSLLKKSHTFRRPLFHGI